MKKLSYIVLGVVIGAIATYFFCPRQTQDSSISIVKPKGVITPEQAKELNMNWTLYRKAAVDSAAKKQGRNQDNRSTWWSLSDIENYLVYAQSQSDSLGYSMTGIRVFLGVYGENAGQTKKNLTTMFMVPTGTKKSSKASSININLAGDDQNIPVPPLNKGTGGNDGYPK